MSCEARPSQHMSQAQSPSSSSPAHPYLCNVVSAWAAVVTEPAEEGLIDPPSQSPGLTVGRQVLATMPQDGVGERHRRA